MSAIEVFAVLSALCMWIIAGFTNAYDLYMPGKSTALTLVKGFFIGFLVTPVMGVIRLLSEGLGTGSSLHSSSFFLFSSLFFREHHQSSPAPAHRSCRLFLYLLLPP